MPPIRSALLSAALVLAPQFACAQAKLDAHFVVTFAGVTIGKGTWVIEIADDQYTAAASGATTGLLRVFASGAGTSAVRGAVVQARGDEPAGGVCQRVLAKVDPGVGC